MEADDMEMLRALLRAKSQDKPERQPARCPRCDGWIPSNENPGAHMGALSRVDNETEICSACGTEEAILAMQGQLTDWRGER